MRFSSNSLVAAGTIAATIIMAGSTIAVPGPLHAACSALEEVNPFDWHDLDVCDRRVESGVAVHHVPERAEVVDGDLLTRRAMPRFPWQDDHARVAVKYNAAFHASLLAARKTGMASHKAKNYHDQKIYKDFVFAL